MKVDVIIAGIDQGAIALPQFQRGYVWNRAQVRGLMESLYRGHPVGGLLTWRTRTEGVDSRGDAELQPGSVQLLLDGQQRITTLYGLIKGTPPPFFEGNAQAFTDLRFHLEEEVFEFWQPVKMRDDPLWLDVHELLAAGPGGSIAKLYQEHGNAPALGEWINRLNRIGDIRNRDFHIEEVAGEDKTVDVVVDIFNRVNSGGTKLSKGDLALAKICGEWPEAREEMRAILAEWGKAGFGGFTLDWLLRVTTAVLTGRARFSALADVPADEVRKGLLRAKKAVDTVLNALSGRLGVNDGSILPATYAIVPLARFADLNGGTLGDHAQRDRLLYWYLHAAMWGRYAGSTETTLAQDLTAITPEGGDPTDRLLALLKQQRGDLIVRPGDFWGSSRGARFYPILYVLTRVTGARDWGTGDPLNKTSLGAHTDLEIHHIFPKSLLYDAGYSRSEVNAIANFTFLTKQTNLAVSNRPPAEYLPEYAALHPAGNGSDGSVLPSAVEGHWIPMNPDFWAIDAYPAFLEQRRAKLAAAANTFLAELHEGHLPNVEITPVEITGDSGDEKAVIAELQTWLAERGFGLGEIDHEVPAPDGSQDAVLDIAWPSGVQHGLSEPVALLMDEPPHVIDAAAHHGYRVFTSPSSFMDYCKDLLLTGAPPQPVEV